MAKSSKSLRFSKMAVFWGSFVMLFLLTVGTIFVSSTDFDFDFRERASSNWLDNSSQSWTNQEEVNAQLYFEADGADNRRDFDKVKFRIYKGDNRPPDLNFCEPGDCGQNAECGEDNQCFCVASPSGAEFANCDENWENGCEVDLRSSDDNCGVCGNTCSSNEHCDNEQCICDTGYADCDGSGGNGCEVNLSQDSDNCGSCGNSCGPNEECSGSDCVCEQGYADCDGEASNGCEALLGLDELNCGSCGNTCEEGEVCVRGECGELDPPMPPPPSLDPPQDGCEDAEEIKVDGECVNVTQGCSQASDCEIVTGCCSCDGDDMAVLREYSRAYGSEKFGDCEGVSCLHVICEQSAICNAEGKCVIGSGQLSSRAVLPANNVSCSNNSGKFRSKASGSKGIVNKVNAAEGGDGDEYLYEEIADIEDEDSDTKKADFNANVFDIEVADTPFNSEYTPIDYYQEEMVGKSYRVWACGCMLDETGDCECVTDYMSFDPHIIDSGYLTADRVDTMMEGFCDMVDEFGRGDIFVGNVENTDFTNRDFFKAVWSNGTDTQTQYVDMTSLSNYFSIEALPDTTYELDVYVCHGRGESADVPYNICEVDPILEDYIVETPDCSSEIPDLSVDIPDGDGNAFHVNDDIKFDIDFGIEGGDISQEDNLGLEVSVFRITDETGVIGEEIIPNIDHSYLYEDDLYTLDISNYIDQADLYRLTINIRLNGSGDFGDPDVSNNLEAVDFTVTDDTCDLVCEGQREVLVLDGDDCYCVEVECLDDSHCGPSRVCEYDEEDPQDPQDNRCVCDDSLCAANKEMNQDCDTCICRDTCEIGQVQDVETCVCYDVCSKSCGEKQILNSNCECVDVECVYDSHCPGREVCITPGYTCQCPSCGTGLIANSDCSACVCASDCESGQIQRSDCSCYTIPSDPGGGNKGDDGGGNGSGGIGGGDVGGSDSGDDSLDDLSDENVEIRIEVPSSNSSYDENEKETFVYKLGEEGDVDTSRIKWYVDGNLAGSGNFVNYTFDESGDQEVRLEYKGEEVDSADIRVLKEDVESQKVGEKDSERSMGIFTYFLIGIGVVILLGFIVLILASKVNSEM